MNYDFDEEYFSNTSELAKDFIRRLLVKVIMKAKKFMKKLLVNTVSDDFLPDLPTVTLSLCP